MWKKANKNKPLELPFCLQAFLECRNSEWRPALCLQFLRKFFVEVGPWLLLMPWKIWEKVKAGAWEGAPNHRDCKRELCECAPSTNENPLSLFQKSGLSAAPCWQISSRVNPSSMENPLKQTNHTRYWNLNQPKMQTFWSVEEPSRLVREMAGQLLGRFFTRTRHEI